MLRCWRGWHNTSVADEMKFYPMLVDDEWQVWEKTHWQMKVLTDADRTLETQMRRQGPFDTRSEAENWIEDRRKRGL